MRRNTWVGAVYRITKRDTIFLWQMDGFRVAVEVGHAAIHLSTDSRNTGQGITIELFKSKPCLHHELIDAPVEIAAAGHNLLQRVKPVLPAGNGGVVTAAVFKEQKAAVRLQDPPDFTQGRRRIRNRTQGEGADGVIEQAIVKG